jgi:NAD(P)-dependent dehydrogenase (short-subunit alcohol dehydrogenase family)
MESGEVTISAGIDRAPPRTQALIIMVGRSEPVHRRVRDPSSDVPGRETEGQPRELMKPQRASDGEMNSGLKGRAAIVTGAGNGLGLEIAQRLVLKGAKALLVDRDEVVLKRIGTEQLPRSLASAFVKDLADDDASEAIFAAAEKSLGPIDVLVNNGAWSFHKPMLDVATAEFDRLVKINQRAPFFLAQAFCRTIANIPVRPIDPIIVNIGSVNALRGNPNLVAYAGTKGAIVAMTRAMAVEMAPLGIRVNSISPGAVETYVTRSMIESGAIDAPKLLEKVPAARFGTCGEIAELVTFLCSADGRYVNGANWVVDGGYMAM